MRRLRQLGLLVLAVGLMGAADGAEQPEAELTSELAEKVKISYMIKSIARVIANGYFASTAEERYQRRAEELGANYEMKLIPPDVREHDTD